MDHLVSLFLNSVLLLLVAYRIHVDDIYESGTMLRLAILLMAVWFLLWDIDHFAPFIDIFPDSPMPGNEIWRFGGAHLILTLGVVLDIFRVHQRRKAASKIKEILGKGV